MKQEFIDKVNNCSLEFCVNLDESGIDDEGGSLCAEDFDHVDYSIRDGKLLSWDGEELMDLADLDDSWFERAMDPKDDEPMEWFDCFITELMNHVIQNDLRGSYEFNNLIDDERVLVVILKNSNDFNIVEEIDDWNIVEHVD